uniref:Transmembrane protein 161B n=1 Tax=Rhizophora mucronata TaxID=61149 RepID=A0A2P2IW63_RHIMU
MLQFFQTYKNPLLQALLCVLLAFLLSFLKIPILFLRGLHTYILPESVGQQNGVKAAIRRPSSSDSGSGLEGYQYVSSRSGAELKRRNKSKERFEFDENNAQIFRLKLDEGHLQSRIYFSDYMSLSVLSFVALSCSLLSNHLTVAEEDRGILANGSLIPLIFGLTSLCRVMLSLVRVSFEKSASKRSEKQWSVLIGVLGFVFGFLICCGFGRSVLDFDFDSMDGFGKASVAVLVGCVAGFLYLPATKNARSFWLGTDQLRSNLDIISCGWFARMILYANYLLVFFTALLWINPLSDMLVRKNIDQIRGTHLNSNAADAEKLVGNIGFTQSDFIKLRLWCLLLSGLLQILAFRPNMQMYLNEAVLSWYQRLHASRVPDLDFSRAKVFLHNHYLCLVVLQFFAPSLLVLLFLSISQVDGNSFKNFQIFCRLLPCSAFTKEVALFIAWWVVFVWAIFTSAILLLYRRGILYVS